MKKITALFMSISVVGFLVACGSTNDGGEDIIVDDEIEVPENTPENETETEDMIDTHNPEAEDQDVVDQEEPENVADNKEALMEQLGIKEFQLEVEYADGKEYEAEIDHHHSHGGYDAEIEDDLKNEKVKGDEAFERVYAMLKNVNATETMDKEEMIAKVLQAFNLDENYKEIEIEIDFTSGTEIEYKDKR